MTNTKYQVSISSGSDDYYVSILGGYMLTSDYVSDGGFVEKYDEETMGNMIPLGFFTNHEIEEMFS